MRAHLHGVGRGPLDLRDLGERVALQPVQLDRAALLVGQREQGLAQERDLLLRLEPGARLNGGLVRSGEHERDLAHAMAPAERVAHQVHGDREHPGAKLRAAAELVPRPVYLQEGVLHDVVGLDRVAQRLERDPPDLGGEAAEQDTMGRDVALRIRGHELLVGPPIEVIVFAQLRLRGAVRLARRSTDDPTPARRGGPSGTYGDMMRALGGHVVCGATARIVTFTWISLATLRRTGSGTETP